MANVIHVGQSKLFDQSVDFKFNDAAEQEERNRQQSWLQFHVTEMHFHVASVHRRRPLLIFFCTLCQEHLACLNAMHWRLIQSHFKFFLSFPNNPLNSTKPDGGDEINSKELKQPSSWCAGLLFACGVEKNVSTPIDHSKNTSVNSQCCSANCYKLDICHRPEHKQARRVNALIKGCSLKVFTDTR